MFVKCWPNVIDNTEKIPLYSTDICSHIVTFSALSDVLLNIYKVNKVSLKVKLVLQLYFFVVFLLKCNITETKTKVDTRFCTIT